MAWCRRWRVGLAAPGCCWTCVLPGEVVGVLWGRRDVHALGVQPSLCCGAIGRTCCRVKSSVCCEEGRTCMRFGVKPSSCCGAIGRRCCRVKASLCCGAAGCVCFRVELPLCPGAPKRGKGWSWLLDGRGRGAAGQLPDVPTSGRATRPLNDPGSDKTGEAEYQGTPLSAKMTAPWPVNRDTAALHDLSEDVVSRTGQ